MNLALEVWTVFCCLYLFARVEWFVLDRIDSWANR